MRCILSNARLNKRFWAETLGYTCHLVNCLPSSAIQWKTPMEVWSRKLTYDYDDSHIFDSLTYYHVKQDKLEPRAKKALFLGFKIGVKGYKLRCLN